MAAARYPWPRTPIYPVFLRASSLWEAIALSCALLIIWLGMLPRFWAIGVNRLVPGGWKQGSTWNPTHTHPGRGRDSVN